ncbi:MAG: sigma-54-dependent Fis family transcriptional regulator [Acidobacteriales bacterium]|nr:sigma-54-dependent Fis family transcriptional regulator [Terriglobales bacterium]
MARLAKSQPLEAHRIAVITADESALPSIEQFLAPVFHTTISPSPGDVPDLLRLTGLEALVLDMEFDGESSDSGLDAIAAIRKLSADLLISAITRDDDPGLHDRALRLGADECHTAPLDFHELQVHLYQELEKRAALRATRKSSHEVAGRFSFCDLIGASEPMRLLYEAIQQVAHSNSAVLIRGESGSGKELVARAIQSLSPRRDKPFISVNCAALPEHLIEAELFGHEKGAFTDAHAARAGHIESAHTGTLFLDEIATLGLGLQSKLLRVLEDHSIQRLGGKNSKKIDFRLLTATNEDLEAMVEAGRFREDLFYRIHVVPIHIPPLREREGDVALLAEHFLQVYCDANKTPLKRIDPDALEVLEEYDWPGNVRQLQNLVQRLVLMTTGPVISLKSLPKQVLSRSTEKQQELLIPDEGIDFEDEMDRIERAYVDAALSRAQGRKFLAAGLLHIPPHKMKYLCRKHGL